MRLAILLLLSSCGRYAFDTRAGDAATDIAATDTPAAVNGCADGTREGFVDLVQFPTIAGCTATWAGTPSVRAAATGTPCGNDLGACGVPADACSPGWHICADTGDPAEISSRVTADECLGVTGAFVAGMQHCESCANTCTMATDCVYAPSYGCSAIPGPCTEPVCCGAACDQGNLCQFVAFGFPGSHAAITDHSCGALDSTGQTGVLCCH